MQSICLYTRIQQNPPILLLSPDIAIPIVVIVALLASLLEAFVILPSHLADFARKRKTIKHKSGEEHDGYGWYNKLATFYTRILKKAIAHKYKTLGIFALAFVLLIFVFGNFLGCLLVLLF